MDLGKVICIILGAFLATNGIPFDQPTFWYVMIPSAVFAQIFLGHIKINLTGKKQRE